MTALLGTNWCVQVLLRQLFIVLLQKARTDMFSSLNEVFEMQEVHARTNLTAMSEEFSLLGGSLTINVHLTIGALNTPHIIAKRRGKSGRIPEIESIQINLAYTTWATIVNACRLLDLWGLCRYVQPSIATPKSRFRAFGTCGGNQVMRVSGWIYKKLPSRSSREAKRTMLNSF